MSTKGEPTMEDSQDESVAMGKREVKQTEKGLQHQRSMAAKSWKNAVRNWRRTANKLRELIVDDELNMSSIKDSRNKLQSVMDEAIASQEKLAEISSSLAIDDESEDKLADLEEEHSSLMKDVMQTLLMLRGDASSKNGSSASKRKCKDWLEGQPPNAAKGDAPLNPVPDPDTKSANNQPIDMTNLFSHLHTSRLPLPEPAQFEGNPLRYPSWRQSYDVLMEHQGVPKNNRFFYLKKYLRGQPLELVQGFSLIDSEDAYDEAMTALQQRYGDPFIISNAFRDKLEAWPRISSRDAQGLRRFSDFLRQCSVAMEKIGNLHQLDDERENRKILAKLPDWLVTKWSRKVYECRKACGSFPTFRYFSAFISEESDIACDPITSLVNVRDGGSRGKSTSRANTLSTGTAADNLEQRKQRTKQECCGFCQRQHRLDKCDLFMRQDLKDRKAFIRKKGLCYGCLKGGHLTKECRRRCICAVCKRQHPTPLHGDMWRSFSKKDDSQGQDVAGTKSKEKDESSATPPHKDDKPEHHTTSSHLNISYPNSTRRPTKCTMIVPVWISHKELTEEKMVYALLDTQSDTTFLLEAVRDSMGLRGTDVSLRLSTMSGMNEKINSERITGLSVRAHNSNIKIDLPPTYTRDIMPANREHIPTPEMAQEIPHLAGISDKLLPLQDCEIGLLVGYDCSKALTPRDVIPAPDDEGPYGVRTDLGWSIMGTVYGDYAKSEDDPIGFSHRILACEIPTDLQGIDHQPKSGTMFSQSMTVKEEITPNQITRMMEADFTPERVERPYSQQDIEFLEVMDKGIHVADTGHYEMPLPFKKGEPTLPNNLFLAEKRLQSLRSKFMRDVQYHEQYTKVMDALITNEYAELVPNPMDLDKTAWYIPHHGVQQPSKLRVVFDCSAQYKGESLNQHLMTGPDMTNALAGVLCRFRIEKVAFMCDVKEMFHQFQVNEEHRDYLRFLWWPNGDYHQPAHHYRMKVHLFGAASSPGCANYGLKRTATDHKDKYGDDAVNFVHNNFYVDDGLLSVPTSTEAIDLISRTRGLCEEGKLHLHKIISNSREVMQAVPVDDRAKSVKELNLLHDDLPIERALGLQWCIESDSFKFRITFADKPCTRRGVLSTVMSLYDPLGLIAPVTLAGKRIVQELCREGARWDDPMTDEMRMRWEKWRQDVICLQRISIPRCFKPTEFKEIKSAQLHHFSDASTTWYGSCAYLRLKDTEGSVHTSLVMGKSRVAPLKHITIPRLELTAAVVATKISSFLENELKTLEAENYFWTDSRVVLGYLNNKEKRFHVFVANRIKQIMEHSNEFQWRHINTKDNPADLASRGTTVKQLMESDWFTGPEFLSDASLPENDEKIYDVLEDDPEVKRSHVSATHVKSSFDLGRLERFSSWHQAKRAVANCEIYKARLRKRCRENSQSPVNSEKGSPAKTLSVDDLDRAQREILRCVQEQSFPDEFQRLKSASPEESMNERNYKRSLKRSSRLYKLDPFIDAEGVLRVGGRLRRAEGSFEVKHPAILPHRHHVTNLVIRHCHEQISHLGRGMTTNQLRANGFWILGCSTAVSKLIRRCVTCNRLRSAPQSQQMSDLPPDRLEAAPPFSYSGMDCFGPWLIKEGRKEMKRYGLLFTCMASRAIHIETLNSLSTDAFINGLRRFISVRGPVRQLRSDRGTNFVGAHNEFKKAWDEMDQEKVKNHLIKEGCDFFDFAFNFPSSSHMGGVWERQIGSVRRVLDALLYQNGQQLDDDSLRTLLCEAAAIVNSRPLTVDNLNEPTHPEPLTPNHLLTQKSRVILPPPGNFPREDVYAKKRWRRVQHLANEFWCRWRKEFLNQLQSRQKWTSPKRNMKVDDIVLIKDDEVPRSTWPLGRVAEVYASDDGLVRKVKIAVGDSKLDKRGKRTTPLCYLERPIHKLVLLVPREDQVNSQPKEPKSI